MAIVAGFDVQRAQITFDALDTASGEISRGRIDATPAACAAWWSERSPGCTTSAGSASAGQATPALHYALLELRCSLTAGERNVEASPSSHLNPGDSEPPWCRRRPRPTHRRNANARVGARGAED
jgi:hypothetical protein